MIKKLKLNAFEGALRTGGFFGWYLTVMYICQTNAGSSELLETVNRTFLLSGVITTAAILIIMIFIDFEGMLADKYLRWVPGLFMAESGIALCLAEARTMTLFAAIAGISASIGAVAMISSLLRVKVSQRIFSVGAGLAIGGIIRVIGNLISGIGKANSVGEIITAVLIGIIAAVTVHTAGFSGDAKPLISRAEAKPASIFRKIPAVYFWVFSLGCAFMVCFCTLEKLCSDAITLDLAFSNKYYNEIAYISFALVAVLAVFIVKPHALASLFATGAALATCGAFLLGLRSPTQAEAVIITVLCFAAYACFQMCMYLIVVTFSLDRPHPLFYALFGYGVITLSEWVGRVIMEFLDGDIYRTIVAVLLVLIPVGAFFISRSMRYSGYSQEQLEKRRRIRQLIARVSEEKELSDREKTMLSLAVLDGYSADMMPDKLGVSRNTVKSQLRGLTSKFEAQSLDDITEKLYAMIEEKEEQLQLEAEQKAEEKSVLAALAAKDAEDEEKFIHGESSDEDSTAEEKSAEAEPASTDEPAVEETPSQEPTQAVIDMSELEKSAPDNAAEENTAETDISENDSDTPAEAEGGTQEDTAPSDSSDSTTEPVPTESEEKEVPEKTSEKASVRVVRKNKKKKNDPKPAETPAAAEEPAAPQPDDEDKPVTPTDRLDDLLSGMDDED